jgi:hypothetical protein
VGSARRFKSDRSVLDTISFRERFSRDELCAKTPPILSAIVFAGRVQLRAGLRRQDCAGQVLLTIDGR